MGAETVSAGAAGRLPLARMTTWRGFAPLFALALYVAGALVTQMNAVTHFSSGCACSGTDPTLFMWSMAWWPHAVLHLPHNPFVSHQLWVPEGLDLAANTSVPTLGLLGAPIDWAFGPVATYNVWMILAPVTGAFCAYRLCRALTGREPASIGAGWLYGFSTYEVTQVMGHLHLVFTFVAPALILLVIRRLDGSIGTRRFIALMTLVLVLEIGISTEMLLTVSISGVILLLAVLICAPGPLRRSLLRLIPAMAGSYLLMAIIVSPFLYYALKGPPVAAGLGTNYGDDLLSFIVPPASTWLGGTSYTYITSHFITDPAETNSYLGLPLIAIFAATMLRLGRDWRLRALLLTVLVLFVWSLSSHLAIKGVLHTTLPFSWFASHTFFDQILPNRIAGYVALGTAVAAALWLSWTAVWWPLRWVAFLAAVVFLFPDPNAPNYRVDYGLPSFFSSGEYRRYIHPNDVVLPLPFGDNGSSLLWQAETHFSFALASGGFTDPAIPAYAAEPATGALLTPVPAAPANDDAVTRAFLIAHRVNVAVIQDATSPGWATVFTSLGATGVSVGGVEVFRFRPPL